MYISKLSKRIVSLALLVFLLLVCQSASATMKASIPSADRVVVYDPNNALNYKTTYDAKTGHLNVHLLPGCDWAAYQEDVQPFNPDCRQPIEIRIVPPKNAVEMCSNTFSKQMTGAITPLRNRPSGEFRHRMCMAQQRRQYLSARAHHHKHHVGELRGQSAP